MTDPVGSGEGIATNSSSSSSSSSIVDTNQVGRPTKHGVDQQDEDAPQAKRVQMQGQTDIARGGAVTEKEVGIAAYVNPGLVPIEGGIIKQRFSDFHVREVARRGQVCRITSLYPPSLAEGGSGLYEAIKAEEAENADASGQLRKDRLDKEAKEQAAQQAERRAERERAAAQTWEWNLVEEQEEKLRKLLGDEGLQALRTIWTAGPKKAGQNGGNKAQAGRDERKVFTLPITVKEERTAAHQLIRELFEGYLLTETVDVKAQDGKENASAIRIRWGSGKPEQRRAVNPGTQHGQERRKENDAPPFVHFLLQKTNRDSQDALNMLARSLNLVHGSGGGRGKAVKELSVAGTKDKRGVTVQQVALRRGRKTLEDVWRMANGLGRQSDRRGGQRRGPLDAVHSRGERGVRIAHLHYGHAPLHLGELDGNEFVIVLRNIKVQSRRVVDAAMEAMKSKGFINYYGMQRFGTSAISTHRVGIALLRNDYCEAVELIMAPREGDPAGVLEARQAYEEGKLDASLSLFPNFNVPEKSIVSRMRADKGAFPVGQRPVTVHGADWKKYFSALPRTLRTMYVHAYQSYIWNRIASERVRRFGLQKAVIGDYVLLSGDEDGNEAGEALKEDGEEILDDDERANAVMQSNGQGGARSKRVKLLETPSDVEQYSIHDVMIPMPGTNVHFPEASWSAEVYQEILAQDGLKPDDIERKGAQSPEMALTGDYRALLHVPRNVSYELVRYTDPDENLVQSDEDQILGLENPTTPVPYENGHRQGTQPSFVAMVLRLTLGVSAYATMALREVLKQETSMAHQRELTLRGEDRVALQLPQQPATAE